MEKNEEKRIYDLTVLLSLEDERFVEELVKKHGGENMVGVRPFSKIKLAYPVRKKTQAFMVAVRFLMEPKSLVSLKENLRHNPQVLRHMVLTVKKKKAAEEKEKKAEEKERRGGGEGGFVSNKDLEEKIKEFE